MLRGARRKNLKFSSDSSAASEKNVKKSSQNTDISKFFKKPEPPEAEVTSLPESSLPSPDAADLPSPSRLSTDPSKNKSDELQPKEKIQINGVHPSQEKSQKASDMTQKIMNGDATKKKKKRTKVSQNSRVTDFFPVRRSDRKTLPNKLKEKHKTIEEFILSGKEDGFEVKEFPEKGRGVVTNKAIKRGDFVLEYYGELIDYEEAMQRESLYATKENIGCYMYYFTFSNKKLCIDATKETERLGRLVNHSKKGNLKTQPLTICDAPHLGLFASRDIAAGEELCYDYGDRSKQALESNPWLAL